MKYHATKHFSSELCVMFLLLLVAQSAAADGGGPWDIGFDVSMLSDDNVTRAYAPAHIREDSATRIKVNARYDLDFSINRALIFTGHLLDESYQDFDGISSTQAGLEAEYRFRTRTGFGAPVYSFFINTTQADYETDIRDGDTLEYGLRLSRQYTDRIALVFGAAQSERTADGLVFDLEQTRYFAQLDYRVPNRFQTYLAWYSISGDVYSISPVAPAAYGGGAGFYEATERDPAFSGLNPWWAYRLDASTDVLRLGFSISVNGNNSFDISMDDIGSETSNSVIDDSGGSSGYGYGGGGGARLGYDTTIIAASYFHRF
jgi:hypothetical protein